MGYAKAALFGVPKLFLTQPGNPSFVERQARMGYFPFFTSFLDSCNASMGDRSC